MASPGKGGAAPAQATSGLFGLNRKQKRLLRFAFLGILSIAAGIGAYLYIANAPQRAQAQFDQAMKLMRPGSYEQAIQGLDSAVKTWPGLASAYFERGNAKHLLGRDDEAIGDFEKAADVDPSYYLAYAAIGSIHRDRKDYPRALAAYTKSIEAKANLDALYERGQMYEALGEHQKAIDDYDRAIGELPDSPAVYRARGLARRNLGDEAGYQADRDRANHIEHRQ